MFTTVGSRHIGKSYGQPREADFSYRQGRVSESFVEGSPFGNYRGVESGSPSPKRSKPTKKT